jgi:hypothetical protein
MRDRWLSFVSLLLATVVSASAAQQDAKPPAGEQYVGTWNGTWDAGPNGSGGIELTLEKDQKGEMAGRVSVTGEPTYKASFKTLTFEGSKMSATYDFPADERAEVLLSAAFDGDKAAGTWTVRAKGTDLDGLSGTWTVTRR